VLLKFHPDTSEQNREAAAAGIRALPDFIPEISNYSVGFDAKLRDDNYDLAVVGDFANSEDYLVYASHPKHLEVISELLVPHLEGRSAVQYECGSE
jgi:hypothetical protein|tara:strand:- start:79716 stop:80003 length:288 start_codon:yes stop_codon:yes gene_type:complete